MEDLSDLSVVPNSSGEFIYVDFHSLIENDESRNMVEKISDFIKRCKSAGYRIGILSDENKVNKTGQNEREQKWLSDKGLTAFIDTYQIIPIGKSKYDCVEDKNALLVDEDDEAISQWFSLAIKVIK